MTRFSGLLAVATVAALVGGGVAEDKKEPAKFDASKLEGKWTVTAMTKYGEKADAPKEAVTITKDSIKTKTDIGEFVFKYTIDAKADPMTIDLEITSDQFKGMKAQGVIKLDGDKLMLAYDVAEPDAKTLTRPKGFESKKESKTLSYVMTKAKEEKKEEKKDK